MLLNNSCKSNICHNKFFPSVSFTFQPNVCNGCGILLQKTKCFNLLALAPVKKIDKKSFWIMSKKEAVTLMKKFDLSEKKYINIAQNALNNVEADKGNDRNKT